MSLKLCGQSTNDTKNRCSTDSLAVAVDYIHNAKNIHQDLIKLDWAIKREVVYKAQISEQEAINQRQAGELQAYKLTTTKLSGELTTTKQLLGEQTLKTKQARLEVWAMRMAVALYIAGKIKGLLP
ncbi:hypothetical protein [Spirosoma spitsbergense]|uniref:hypothetical protein n=1 Tax=Spirosoma spitsbergense TaxID=431554 RepID=UPI00146CE8B7|nr:hypothetical protein [Spirosoma spitsbergense]